MFKKQKPQDQQISFDTLKTIFYPEYPPNASETQFISYYEPLFQQLRKFDIATEDQLKKAQFFYRYSGSSKIQKIDDMDKILFFIIEELNNLCTFCHRKQLRLKINDQLSKYKNNLKNIPIGKKPIKISHWQEMFSKKPAFEDVNNEKKQQIITILDKIYQQHKKIPNYYMLFLLKQDVLINLYNFQQKIIFDSKCDKTSMPLAHKYFLGVIAASTYGCRYLWNLMVEKFLKYGGDKRWIQIGLDQYPQYIKKFSQISYQIAYQFKTNILEDICFQLGKMIQNQSILQGLYILSYYQFLACVSLVFGLIPESIEHQKQLPAVAYIKPSLQSFQTMKKASKKQYKYENQVAKQFQEMYSWDKDSDKQNIKRVESQILQIKTHSKKIIDKSNSFLNKSSDSTNSSPQINESIQNELMVTYEQQEIIRKIKTLKTMKNIEDIFGKYIQFDKRRSLIEFNRKTSRKVKSNSTANSKQQTNSSEDQKQPTQNQSSQNQQQVQYDFIYASEWNFQDNAGNLMDQVISPKFHSTVSELLKCLKFVDKQKSRNLKMYYESLQNYMYEYISYVDLINQNLSLVEKNYVKLLTRSPFLFNQKSFSKMKQDLQTVCKICKPFRFCLQIFSFKLEHSLSLASYAYDRYIENT